MRTRVLAIGVAIALLLLARPASAQSPPAPAHVPSATMQPDARAWSFFASAYTYIIPDDSNYAQPTFTADLAQSLIDAVDAGASGLLHLTAAGSCSWFEFTEAIMELAGIDAPIEPVQTTIGPGQPDRPLNGVLARPRADALGLAPLRHWRDALADYMSRAA